MLRLKLRLGPNGITPRGTQINQLESFRAAIKEGFTTDKTGTKSKDGTDITNGSGTIDIGAKNSDIKARFQDVDGDGAMSPQDKLIGYFDKNNNKIIGRSTELGEIPKDIGENQHKVGESVDGNYTSTFLQDFLTSNLDKTIAALNKTPEEM